MMRMIAHLNAELHRAQQDGAKSMQISLLDLTEILRAAESHATRDEAARAKRHAGWCRPESLQGILNGERKDARIMRKRNEEHCCEIFIQDNLAHLISARKAAEVEV